MADEREELDSLTETNENSGFDDEELDPAFSEGEEAGQEEPDNDAGFDEPEEENPWEYSTRFDFIFYRKTKNIGKIRCLCFRSSSTWQT